MIVYNRMGIPCSKETSYKISCKHIEGHKEGRYKTRKGQLNSEEHRKNISESRKGKELIGKRKTYKITHPNGNIEIITGLAKWCKEHNLHTGNMSSVAYGRLSHYKGFKAQLIK